MEGIESLKFYCLLLVLFIFSHIMILIYVISLDRLKMFTDRHHEMETVCEGNKMIVYSRNQLSQLPMMLSREYTGTT